MDIVWRRKMVIVNMDVSIRTDDLGEFPDAAGLTSVDQDQTFHLVEVDILDPFHFKRIQGRMDEKISKAPLLRPWKDQNGMGIELLGGHHGGQGVKVSIGVGGNDFHHSSSPEEFDPSGVRLQKVFPPKRIIRFMFSHSPERLHFIRLNSFLDEKPP